MNNSYQAGIDGANGQRNLVVRWRGGKIDSGYARFGSNQSQLPGPVDASCGRCDQERW